MIRFQIFPFLREVVMLNFYAMFDGHVVSFQSGRWELHVMALFKNVHPLVTIIKKGPGIGNNCPCFATTHLRGELELVLHTKQEAQNVQDFKV
jgi:hypothetical protein